MNERYGEQRDNGESQQYGQRGRFWQTDRDREGYGRDEYRGRYGGAERYDERHVGRDEGQSRRYGGEAYGEGGRGQGYYSGGVYGESQRGGQGSYPDQEQWRGESGRAFYGRRDEQSGYGGMRGGYGGGWESGQGGGGQYGQGQYEAERYGERGWESGRERGGIRGTVGRLFGRGPKGYKRSDERIKEDICERLWRSDNVDSSEVTITVKEGEVTLSGTVPERWMRHEIENIVDDSMGVKEIDNSIRIRRQTDETGAESMSATRGASAAGMKK
jgi:osmotically-inducible protein OsmY